MKLLVIGGCGFLGSNLAAHGIKEGYEVTVFDNLSRFGAAQNLVWLRSLGKVSFFHGDTRNQNDVEQVVIKGAFDAIFHLAGQVAMTTSIADPYKDFQTNTMGAVHVLEAVRRHSPDTAVFFSSTNKVYGDLEQYSYRETDTRYLCEEWPKGFDETVPLDFRSPYGCSKGAADQYMLDYARIYGIRTTVFRHSSMYGGRQFATYDQGWVGWFCTKAVEKKKHPNCEGFTISGNGKQVRDILHAKDMVSLYYSALSAGDKVAGQVFNIGGGMGQSLSLLELFALLNDMLGIQLEYTQCPPRVSDQKVFVADISKAKRVIGWTPRVTAKEGIAGMLSWTEEISCHPGKNL